MLSTFISLNNSKGYLQTERYILAQTPMPSTLEDFVSLLYQEKIGLVVSLDEEDVKDKVLMNLGGKTIICICLSCANKLYFET
jgi:protein tyrosine phosphatase